VATTEIAATGLGSIDYLLRFTSAWIGRPCGSLNPFIKLQQPLLDQVELFIDVDAGGLRKSHEISVRDNRVDKIVELSDVIEGENATGNLMGHARHFDRLGELFEHVPEMGEPGTFEAINRVATRKQPPPVVSGNAQPSDRRCFGVGRPRIAHIV